MPSTAEASRAASLSSPNAPPITPRKLPEEPDSGGWDASEADTVNKFPEPSELPEPRAAAATPATQAPGTNVPPTPNSPGTVRGPYQTSPGIGTNNEVRPAAGVPAARAPLPSQMRDEVWAIVRAAVDEAVGPLVAKQRELEARAERAERAAEAARSVTKPAALPLTATGTIIGVPPPKITIASAVSLAPSAMNSIPVTAASLPPEDAVSEAPPAPVRIAARSLPPTDSYGVTVMPSTRPKLDMDSVGAVDISGFDGGARKKTVARLVVFIMVAIIVTVVTMTLLSHN